MIRVDDLVGYTRQQLKRLKNNLERASDTGEVEAIHKTRVASRRLKEPLLLMDTWVRPKKLKRVQKDLRRIRQTFQEVRDIDVLQIHVCKAGTLDILDPADLAYVEGTLTTLREKALESAQRKARRQSAMGRVHSIARVLDDVERKIDKKMVDSKPLDDLLQRRANQLLASEPAEDHVDLHDIRLRVKRLRYCAELCERLTADETGDLIRSAKKMQDVLGTWNDYLSAVQCFSQMAGDRNLLICQTQQALRLLNYTGAWCNRSEELRVEALQRWPQLKQWVHVCVSDAEVNPSVSPPKTPSESA